MSKKNSDLVLFSRIFKYAKPVIKTLIFALLLSIIAILVDLTIPYLNGLIVKELGSENIVFNNVIYILIGGFSLILVSNFIMYFNNILLQKCGQKIIYDVRQDIFSHIESLSISQINATPIGKLVTRVTSDTNALNELVTTVFFNLIKYSASLIGVTVMMFILNVKLTLIMLIIAPILTILTLVFKRYSRLAYREVRSNISNLNSFLSENFSGIKLTQIFNQEDKILDNFKDKNNELKRSNIKEIFVFGIFRPSIYVLSVVAMVLVLYVGSKDILAGTFQVYALVIFYQYIDKFFAPIQNLANQFNIMQSSLAASERIFEMLDVEIEITDNKDSVELNNVLGEIEFRNVWFAYNNDEWILKDVSFKIEANKQVAFVGATGAGKTTILALIVRNYEIQKGEILIDGINIKNIKMESLRRNIGQMLQDVFLFSGTILENIRMRDDSITKEEIEEACKYVSCDTIIDKLPDRYDYKVYERGNNFSSGEKQLISFARTLVFKPKIMILDEATANIDTQTEKVIQNSLEKMKEIGTMLVVAHRLSTVQHADMIVVLHKGEIIEMGNHQELLHKKGHYFNLYQLQYKGQVE